MSSSYVSGQFRIRSRSLPLAGRGWEITSDPRPAVEAATAALERGDVEAASEIAEKAVRAGAEHPLLLNLGALALERAEAFTTALAWLRRAVQIAPGDAAARNALGLCLQNLGELEAALAEFDTVLALAPGLAPAHCNRGFVLAAMGELKAAEASHRRALELAPGHLGAVFGLASLADRFGDHVEARTLAAQVLAAQPGYPPAVTILAAAEAALGAPAAAETRLRALLADPEPSPLHKAFAMGRLGDVLDALDRTSGAFEAYAASAAEQRRLHAPRFARSGGALEKAEALACQLERMPQWTSPRHIGSRPGGPDRHVFLLGFARSATTLLEQALAGHEQIRVLSERETLRDAAAEFLGDPGGLERLMASGDAALESWREAYWRRVRQAGIDPSGAVFVDKHPFNSLRLPLIARLFPEAPILFAVRDPRDVVLSCLRRRFDINPVTFELLTLEGCARLYSAAMRISRRTSELTRLRLRLRLVKHEQLATDFDAEIARICAFLGIGPTPAMADFAGRIRARGVNTPSAAQLARGLDVARLGQWRRYAAHLEPALPILAPWIERFGYADGPAGAMAEGSASSPGEISDGLGGRIGRSSRI